MEMEYKQEGSMIICKAGGEMPDELLRAIKALGIIINGETDKI